MILLGTLPVLFVPFPDKYYLYTVFDQQLLYLFYMHKSNLSLYLKEISRKTILNC